MGTLHPIIEPAASSRRGWAIFAILLVGLSLAFMRVHKVADGREAGLPLRVVDQASLNFGQRKVGEKFDWPIRIKNHGDKPITIARFATSCECSQIQPAALPLSPGETSTLLLSIRPETPTGKTGRTEIVVTGYREQGQVVFQTNVYGLTIGTDKEQQ